MNGIISRLPQQIMIQRDDVTASGWAQAIFFYSVTIKQLYRLMSLMSCDMFDEYCQYDQSSLSLGQPQSGG